MKQEVSLDKVHRLLAPRPACLLTVRYKGRVNVMSIGWTCPISIEPPLLTLAIHPSAYTHDLLKGSAEGVLNIPGRNLAEQVLLCGVLSGQDADKLQLTGLTFGSGRRVEAPWIEECLAHIECAVVDIVAPGDHTLFICQVAGAWAENEAFAGNWQEAQDDELLPLVHLGGKHFVLPGRHILLPESKPDQD
jgi:flavin reductase (DIM6/NTAB) family NADH-FMN oxidoreductase RutF